MTKIVERTGKAHIIARASFCRLAATILMMICRKTGAQEPVNVQLSSATTDMWVQVVGNRLSILNEAV